MRRIIILLFFVLAACLTQPSEARKLALLVGVDEYENVQSLKCCVNDMKTLKEALMKIGFREDNIHILVTGGEYRYIPTKKKIEQKLSDILSMAQPNDLVFIAFSGHGAQNGKNVYFCPPDTDLDDLEGTCVSITKVMDDIAQCPAKFKWVVVDACRNDPASTRATKGLQVIPSPPSGIALFQSCAKGELSYEEKRPDGNGYFTKNFAAALSGEADANNDGRLTLFEVCDWTSDHTKSDVKKAENAIQRPYISGAIPNFIITEDLNVPKAKALAEEAQKAMDAEKYELAVKKYDEAIALCPRFESWKRERNLAQRFLNSQTPAPSTNENDFQLTPPDNIVQPPAFPIAPAASNPADAGSATRRFHKLSEQAKGYYQKFMDYEKEFSSATPARKKEIQEEVQKMAETISSFKAPMIAAAKDAFKEAPNQDDAVKTFLLNNIVMMINYDDYENALKECDELIRLGLVDQSIFEIAAFSAFNCNNFAYSESAIANAKKLAAASLTRAKAQGKTQSQIDKEDIGKVHPGLADIEEKLPYYKAAWAKEKVLRQASAQAKDCPLVLLQTTAGDITVELFAKEAPNTVANFIELVNKGFYDGLTFHRVEQGFMAQGGDPLGNGTGGPGYCIPCEVDNPNARIHFRGSLSVAHAGKDTGGSQFFITFVPTKWLDGKHTVFGRVSSGLDNLAKITRSPDPNIPGQEPTKIIKAEVVYMPPQLKLPPVKKLPEKR